VASLLSPALKKRSSPAFFSGRYTRPSTAARPGIALEAPPRFSEYPGGTAEDRTVSARARPGGAMILPRSPTTRRSRRDTADREDVGQKGARCDGGVNARAAKGVKRVAVATEARRHLWRIAVEIAGAIARLDDLLGFFMSMELQFGAVRTPG